MFAGPALELIAPPPRRNRFVQLVERNGGNRLAPVCFAITCVRIAGENAGEVKSVYDLLSSKPGGLELLKDPKLVTATAEVATKSSCCPTLVFQQQAFFASSTINILLIPGAGHPLRAVRVFGRAFFILAQG